MKSRIITAALMLLMLQLIAGPAQAAWTDVRDLVRDGDTRRAKADREVIYRKALAAAMTSLKQDASASNEHLWLAVAAGRLAQVASTKERIKLCKVVKESAERAIALDKRNALAYAVLGEWNFYVSEISWIEKSAAQLLYGEIPPASSEKAIELLTLALQYGVDCPAEVYYVRGRAHEELGNDALSAADYRRCLACKATSEKESDCQRIARKRLE